MSSEATEEKKVNQSKYLPLELLDKSVGKQVLVLMRGYFEIVGTLVGYDDYGTMVLEDVVETQILPEGNKTTRSDQILLNGAQDELFSLVLCLAVLSETRLPNCIRMPCLYQACIRFEKYYIMGMFNLEKSG